MRKVDISLVSLLTKEINEQVMELKPANNEPQMSKFNVKSTNRDLFYQIEEKLLEYHTEMVKINQTKNKYLPRLAFPFHLISVYYIMTIELLLSSTTNPIPLTSKYLIIFPLAVSSSIIIFPPF